MDIVTGLSISTNWKRDSYNFMLVIIDQLTKMAYYKPVKVTINVLRLAEVIINVVVWYHGLADLIITNRGLPFILKFWLLLLYFLSIKPQLSIVFTSKQIIKSSGKTTL